VKKVVVILALVLLAAAVALVVLRPGSKGGDPAKPGGLVDGIGNLLPAQAVAQGDVTGQPCWAGQTLTVPAAGTCVTRLPSAATRLTLCTTAGVPDVRVDGTKYGPQRIKAEQLSCTDPGAIRLYDEGSRLIVVCLGTVPCRLRLV
jgi:hypothetical protein